jgi:hypothetical protein
MSCSDPNKNKGEWIHQTVIVNDLRIIAYNSQHVETNSQLGTGVALGTALNDPSLGVALGTALTSSSIVVDKPVKACQVTVELGSKKFTASLVQSEDFLNKCALLKIGDEVQVKAFRWYQSNEINNLFIFDGNSYCTSDRCSDGVPMDHTNP